MILKKKKKKKEDKRKERSAKTENLIPFYFLAIQTHRETSKVCYWNVEIENMK